MRIELGEEQEDTKRWAAMHKSALMVEILQGKTPRWPGLAGASRGFDLTPSEIERGLVRC